MAWDIALDPATGDWLFGANLDWQAVRGDQVVKQRIMNRLKIRRGWINDPTNGTLGSRLLEAARLPRERAIRELPLMVEEALAPMRDVEILNVAVEEFLVDSVRLNIEYIIVNEFEPSLTELRASDVATISIPI